jgi:hypothetical protein
MSEAEQSWREWPSSEELTARASLIMDRSGKEAVPLPSYQNLEGIDNSVLAAVTNKEGSTSWENISIKNLNSSALAVSLIDSSFELALDPLILKAKVFQSVRGFLSTRRLTACGSSHLSRHHFKYSAITSLRTCSSGIWSGFNANAHFGITASGRFRPRACKNAASQCSMCRWSEDAGQRHRSASVAARGLQTRPEAIQGDTCSGF